MMQISEALKKARAYERDFAVSAEEKPLFHVAAPVGWLNDPNGFSAFGGLYHLFYQYHPYSKVWGPMHWGHSVTADFVHWRALPCALAPDTKADRDGCFSGTAIEHNGKHILMYTGVADGKQAQCVAVGDGADYEKLAGNPVIDRDDADFRDPKLYYDGEKFGAFVAHRGDDGSGEILEYRSSNLTDWEQAGVFDKSSNQSGRMWECPDLFTLDGKRVLVFSAQEMEADGNEIHPGNVSLYLTYNADNTRLRGPRAIDCGLDFYAPQTTKTPDGRRVMTAWAGNWENDTTPKEFRYSGILTFPREITLDNGILMQVPARELDAFLTESAEQTKGRVFDLRISADTDDWFEVKIASGGERYTSLVYDRIRNRLTFDRTRSGVRRDVLHSRTIGVRDRGGKIDLRVLADKYIVEVFVNGGEQVMTNLIYTPLECDGIGYDGSAYRFEAKKYDLIL